MAMKQLLDHLLTKAENSMVECQVVLKGGATMPGALRKGPVDDVYQVRSILQDQNSREQKMADIYFTADEILTLFVKVEQKIVSPHTDISKILTPV